MFQGHVLARAWGFESLLRHFYCLIVGVSGLKNKGKEKAKLEFLSIRSLFPKLIIFANMVSKEFEQSIDQELARIKKALKEAKVRDRKLLESKRDKLPHFKTVL